MTLNLYQFPAPHETELVFEVLELPVADLVINFVVETDRSTSK